MSPIALVRTSLTIRRIVAKPTSFPYIAAPHTHCSNHVPNRLTSKSFASQAAATSSQHDEAPPDTHATKADRPRLTPRAKQRQSNKEFFTDLLSSASTKRDAKTYINWLKEPQILGGEKAVTKQNENRSKTAPSGFFAARTRAVDESPTFKQHADVKQQPSLATGQTMHLALVKIRNVSCIADDVLQGIARTLSQLSRLSMSPCVVLEESAMSDFMSWRKKVNEQVERLINAIESVGDTKGRKLDNLLTFSKEGRPTILSTNMLYRTLRHDRIPIIPPIAYDETQHSAVQVSADTSIVAFAQEFSNVKPQPTNERSPQPHGRSAISLDRIIIIDEAGGIPSTKSSDQMHVFVNLAQEYPALQEELRSSSSHRVSSQHASNLKLMRDTLRCLPPTTSGLITTPLDAANVNRADSGRSISGVGTRRQKNALIHNLLTDKPVNSSSLPTGRLTTDRQAPVSPGTTFVKLGMPLTILPEPSAQPWRADGRPRLRLTDPRIDLDRLVYLINDSFNRELDVDAYLKRVNDRIAGLIIAGDYEGGAVLTWETPPGVNEDDDDPSRLVPYLDKFAVLKRAQGAGGVADIVFNAMVRTCFPDGVCWRSRKDNPVNKWYFERSRGTWKIPGGNWTMFWTTPNLTVPLPSTAINDDDVGSNASPLRRRPSLDRQRERHVSSFTGPQNDDLFLDYEGVCRTVQPTWADKKKVAD